MCEPLSGKYDYRCHFSLAVYDIENGKLTYADTLGWPAPLKLVEPLPNM